MEQATVDRLLSEGKLSLIVDLDQTLIHATVGAAIDEWVNAQGEMPKVRRPCHGGPCIAFRVRRLSFAASNPHLFPQDIRMFPLPDSPTPYYIKLRYVREPYAST